jgi:hypothetical protein
MEVLPFSLDLYNTRTCFGQTIWDKLRHFCGIFWVHILGCILGHVVPPHCSSGIFILNLVHHQIWLKFLQKLGYLLWFTIISLISYGASFFLFFSLGETSHFDLPITKKNLKFQAGICKLCVVTYSCCTSQFVFLCYLIVLQSIFVFLFNVMWFKLNSNMCVEDNKTCNFRMWWYERRNMNFFSMWNHFLKLWFTRTTYEI